MKTVGADKTDDCDGLLCRQLPMSSKQDWATLLVSMIENNERFLSYGNVARVMGVLCKKTAASVSKMLPGLLPHQRSHIITVLNTLTKYQKCLDTSVMGAGKTYTTLYAARKLNKAVVVYGPPLTENGWTTAATHVGIDVEFYPYSVCQRKKIPYIRVMQDVVDGVTIKRYIASMKWQEKVHDGLMLVLDESQNLKNKTARTDCLVSLCRIVNSDKNSVLMCLSATPFDKAEHTVNLLRVMGIVRADRLATMNPGTQELVYEGLQELITYCRRVTPNTPINYNRWKPAHDIAHFLAVTYLKPHLFHSMAPPPKQYVLDVCNFFATLDEEGRQETTDGVAMLQKALSMLQSHDPAIRAAGNGLISKALAKIELGKANTFARLAREKLMSDLTCKVVIMLNYTAPLERIRDKLAWARPLIINGPVKNDDRQEALRLFQDESLTHRLLITNLGITATGVNLDDRFGNRQRLLLVSPSYKTINLHQASGRIDRVTTLSQPVTKYVYANQVTAELRILDSLARKSSCIRSSLKYAVSFPGDHVKEYE